MAWQEPKTDWQANPKNPMAEDFNRIEGNVDFLKTDIETKKGAIVDALNTVGLASELADTHATLASRITGSNQGTKIITPGTTNQTIAKGFHNGSGYVKGDSNLRSSNIKRGVSIFGISGSYVGNQPVEGNAETSHVLAGKTFSSEVAGIGVTGTMPNRGAVVITPGTSNKAIQAGYHNGSGYVKGDADLKAENIKRGINIFGVLGAYFPEPVVETITFDYSYKGATTIGHGDEVSVSFNFPRRGYFIASGTCRSPEARLVIDGTVIGNGFGIGGGKWVQAGGRLATWTITSLGTHTNSWMSLAGFMVLFAQ